MLLGDRQDHGLYRRQPQREGAREMLDQDPDEPLHRAVDNAVYGDRGLALAIFVHIFQLEARRLLEVQLYSAHLPFATQCVIHKDVHFGSVEGTVFFGDRIFLAALFQDLMQGSFGLVPDCHLAQETFRPRAQTEGIFHVEDGVETFHYLEHTLVFRADILFPDEDMGIVLPEFAHTQEAVQCPRQLVAMQGIGIRKPQWQIFVTAQLVAKDHHRVRTVHGFYAVLLALSGLRGEHVRPVVLVVSGDDIKLFLIKNRRDYLLIAARGVLFSPETNKLVV